MFSWQKKNVCSGCFNVLTVTSVFLTVYKKLSYAKKPIRTFNVLRCGARVKFLFKILGFLFFAMFSARIAGRTRWKVAALDSIYYSPGWLLAELQSLTEMYHTRASDAIPERLVLHSENNKEIVEKKIKIRKNLISSTKFAANASYRCCKSTEITRNKKNLTVFFVPFRSKSSTVRSTTSEENCELTNVDPRSTELTKN